MKMELIPAVARALEELRRQRPLIHHITNFVTMTDCANATLAIGASPTMTNAVEEVAEMAAAARALVLNLGTLQAWTLEAMLAAGKSAAAHGVPIVFDPVGAGASDLRTDTASALLDELPVTLLRGNMSEIKAVAGAAAATRGVDANPDDAVTDANLTESAAFARSLAAKAGCVVAVTGAIDLVADADRAYAVRNGLPVMGKAHPPAQPVSMLLLHRTGPCRTSGYRACV